MMKILAYFFIISVVASNDYGYPTFNHLLDSRLVGMSSQLNDVYEEVKNQPKRLQHFFDLLAESLRNQFGDLVQNLTQSQCPSLTPVSSVCDFQSLKEELLPLINAADVHDVKLSEILRALQRIEMNLRNNPEQNVSLALHDVVEQMSKMYLAKVPPPFSIPSRRRGAPADLPDEKTRAPVTPEMTSAISTTKENDLYYDQSMDPLSATITSATLPSYSCTCGNETSVVLNVIIMLLCLVIIVGMAVMFYCSFKDAKEQRRLHMMTRTSRIHAYIPYNGPSHLGRQIPAGGVLQEERDQLLPNSAPTGLANEGSPFVGVPLDDDHRVRREEDKLSGTVSEIKKKVRHHLNKH